MKAMTTPLKDGVMTGLLAGIFWGWVSMALNSLTGVVPFEGSFTHNLVSFTVGGAVFGVVTAGFLATAGRFLPFKPVFAKAAFASAVLWIILRIGGDLLSHMEPERYHLITPETVQGFALSIVLGFILALFWKKEGRAAA